MRCPICKGEGMIADVCIRIERFKIFTYKGRCTNSVCNTPFKITLEVNEKYGIPLVHSYTEKARKENGV